LQNRYVDSCIVAKQPNAKGLIALLGLFICFCLILFLHPLIKSPKTDNGVTTALHTKVIFSLSMSM